MKIIHFSSICAAALLSSTVLYAAEFEVKGWQWQSVLEIPKSFNGYVALEMDPELFGLSRRYPCDFRVVDGDEMMVPHVVQCDDPHAVKEVRQQVNFINRSYAPNEYVRAVLDFGEKKSKNRLQVRMSGNNYRRKVLLEGSQDAENWETISDRLLLFNFSSLEDDSEGDELRFQINNFQYLRLTVYNMPDDPERIHIHEVIAIYSLEKEDAELLPVHIAASTIRGTTDTYIDIDLHYRNLPLDHIDLDVKDERFIRRYQVFGRNSEREVLPRLVEGGWSGIERETPWNWMGEGMIYRIHEGQNISVDTVIPVRFQGYRYLKIIVENEDNPPLSIQNISIQRMICRLIFPVEPEQHYFLYCGNPKADCPDFDLAVAWLDLQGGSIPQAHLQKWVQLQLDEDLPWTERHHFLILLILILLVGGMLAFILPALWKTEKQ